MADESSYWKSVFWRRMSRRGFIRAAAASGVALGVGGVLGCQPEQQPAASKETPTSQGTPAVKPTPIPAQPKRGGIWRRYTNNDAPHLDYHTAVAGHTYTHLGYVYSSLIRVARLWDLEKSTYTSAKLYPEIAESWEMPDNLTHVFKIRKGVKFHNLPPVNGRELTAEDVKWSFDRIRSPEPEYTRKSMFEPVTSIEAVDNYTLRIKLKEPFAPFLMGLGDSWNAIAAKEVVARDGDLKTTAIGTGPFYVDKWNRGVGFEHKRNPDYFIKGLPYLDGVRTTIIKDAGTIAANFRTGDLDLISVDTADVASLKQTMKDAQFWGIYGGRQWTFLNNQTPPFDDKNVRKACIHATNYQDYIDIIWGGKAKRNGPIEYFLAPWALPESELPKFDLKLAKEYMAKSKYPNGAKVQSPVFDGSYSQVCMEIAQRHWKEIGIDLQLQLMPLNSWLQKVVIQKDYAVSSVADNNYADPHEWLYTYWHSKGSNNRARYSNPEYDKLAEAQRIELNETKRIEMIHKLQRMLIEDGHSIDLTSWERHTALQPYVRGLKPYLFQPQGAGGGFEVAEVWYDK